MSLMCCSCVVATVAIVVVSAITGVIVTSSVVARVVVHCLHSSVEVASHAVDGCCEVDVVWSSCDAFVEMNVVSESPVVCTRRCEGCRWVYVCLA